MFTIVVQVPVLIAYVRDRQNGLGAERMLNAGTVLRAGRRLVTVDVQTNDIRRLDGLERGRSTGRKQDVRVLQLTLFRLTFRLNGMFGPALYISLP